MALPIRHPPPESALTLCRCEFKYLQIGARGVADSATFPGEDRNNWPSSLCQLRHQCWARCPKQDIRGPRWGLGGGNVGLGTCQVGPRAGRQCPWHCHVRL